MHVTKGFVMNVDDASILKENAKRLGLTESSFVKLCILIGSKELGLPGDYSFKYSYLKWHKPDDLIQEIKGFIESNEGKKDVAQKTEQKKEQVEEVKSKDEKKEREEVIKKPKIQL